MIKCRHCSKAKATRPRGLCWRCYYCYGVRDLYPVDARYGPRNFGEFNGDVKLPTPTKAKPGTPEKVEVLVERAKLNLSLFHPEDAAANEDAKR